MLVVLIIPGIFAFLAFSVSRTREDRPVLYLCRRAYSQFICAYGCVCISSVECSLRHAAGMRTYLFLFQRHHFRHTCCRFSHDFGHPYCMFARLLSQWEAWSSRPSIYDSFCTLCVLFWPRQSFATLPKPVQPSHSNPQSARMDQLLLFLLNGCKIVSRYSTHGGMLSILAGKGSWVIFSSLSTQLHIARLKSVTHYVQSAGDSPFFVPFRLVTVSTWNKIHPFISLLSFLGFSTHCIIFL